MKINLFFVCISTLIALLLAYLVFFTAKGDKNDVVCGICSAVCFIGTLVPMLSIRHKSERIATNLRVLSTIFFLLFVASHFCFAIFGVLMPYYVVLNFLALLVFMAIYYGIGRKTNEV